MKTLLILLLGFSAYGQTNILCEGDDCTITSCDDVNGIELDTSVFEDADGNFEQGYSAPEGYSGIAKYCAESENLVLTYFNGEVVTYRSYVHGKLSQKYSLVNGKKHGKELTYHTTGPTGQLFYLRNFKDGKLEGVQKNYYENGQLKFEDNFKDDKLISETCWDKDGNELDCSQF